MDEQIDRILRGTLEDNRLSRGEKRVLRDVLAELGKDERQVALLRHRAFQIARDQLTDANDQAVVEWLEDVVKALVPRPASAQPDSESAFSPEDNCPRKIASLLARARRNVDICVFTITDDRITDAILQTHRRGVRVRVISDNAKSLDLGSDVQQLARQGVPVRIDRSDYHMHHKFAVFDERYLLTGSYNWTRSAARHNEENFIVTHDEKLVRDFTEAFERLWQKLAQP